MTNEPQTGGEKLAIQRFALMNAARIGSLLVLLAGIAIAVGSLGDYPKWLGIVMSVAGFIGFYFAPSMLARRWKAQERDQGQ
ncbi:MAG: hypothetical protein ABJP48_11975 [Erythrobacter sp.]